MNLTPYAPVVLPPSPTPNVTRIALVADVHLRNSVSGSTVRGEDFFTAAQSVIERAAQRGCCAVFNAGDFLDTPALTANVWDQVVRLDDMAKQFDIPVYTITGNHDKTDPSWVSTLNNHPDTLKGIHDANYRTITLPGGLRVGCLPFMEPRELRECLANVTQTQQPDVIMWHGAVKEWAGFPSEGMVEAADFAVTNAKAILLGDIHITKFHTMQMSNGGAALIGYPGATELAKSDDPLDHYFAVIDFCNLTRAVVGLELVRTAHRKVVPLNIDTQDKLDAAVEKVKQESDAHGGRIMVLCVCLDTITGAVSALHRAAGPRAVVRVDTYSQGLPAGMLLAGMAFNGNNAEEEQAIASLEDRFRNALPGDTEMAALLVQCLNPDAPVNDLVRSFVSRRLEQLQLVQP